MLSWKMSKKERKWNMGLAFTICEQISETLTSLLVLSRSVWTILQEMMSRLREKYMCLHPAEIVWALGNANNNFWQIFGVRVLGVLLDLSLTGPYISHWSAPPGAHLNQKLTLAHTYNLIFIYPDKKDLSGKPR